MNLNSAIKLFILSMVLMTSNAAFASIAAFTGHWRNVDNNTSGVTRLDIMRSGVEINVHAWGKCHPRDCDWGNKQGVVYGPSVGANVMQTASAVTVVYKTSYKVTIMVLKVHRGGLRADVFTRFTDNSHRSAYVNSYQFVRNAHAVGAPKQGLHLQQLRGHIQKYQQKKSGSEVIY